MRTIAHISDIHFGRHDPRVTEALLQKCLEVRPHLVVVSGDLTQRARKKEFEEARRFISRLQSAEIPCMTIPGNHDIYPFYRPLSRLVKPYERYDKYISDMALSCFQDEEIAVIGVNTVSRMRIKNGNVAKQSLQRANKWLSRHENIRKIVVTHHPIDLPERFPRRRLARKSKKAISLLSRNNVTIYLSGHYHESSVVETSRRHPIPGYSAIAIQAGTVSKRLRHNAPSFNLLHIAAQRIAIRTFGWDSTLATFSPQAITTKKGPRGYPRYSRQ